MVLEAWRSARFAEVENWSEGGAAAGWSSWRVGEVGWSRDVWSKARQQQLGKQERERLNTGILISPNTSVRSNSIGEQLNIALFSASQKNRREGGKTGGGGNSWLSKISIA